tara:strand:- start:1269 stop:2612 length:1344 start_codon:yes stop_codon:yes gene_type:complete
MKLLKKYILKEHFTPFFYSLLIVIFLLFTNFLLRAIDRFLGKGISLSIILEYLFMNLGWILALATPMAILIATLMSYGRFSEDNELTALKSSGISFLRIIYPGIIFSALIAIPLIGFNNFILPEMNYKARMLARDIYKKKPDLNIDVGYFIDDLPKYSFIIKGKKRNKYQNIHIYGKDRSKTQTTIRAEEGEFETIGNNILVTLYNGEIHEVDTKVLQNYRRIIFEKHQIIISLEDFTKTKNSKNLRTDREMNVKMLNNKINIFNKRIQSIKSRMKKYINKIDSSNFENIEHYNLIMKLTLQKKVSNITLLKKISEQNNKDDNQRAFFQRLLADMQMIKGYEKNKNKYLVEIHKKFSLPIACTIFILIGAPLGIINKKGGFFIAIVFSFIFILLYYLFLIGGEGMADRNMIHGGLAMWLPNIVLGLIGLILIYLVSNENYFSKNLNK